MSDSLDVEDVLDVEPEELDVASVLDVLVDAAAVLLSDVSPSDESAEAMAATSGLTDPEPDELVEESPESPDVWLVPVDCPASAW